MSSEKLRIAFGTPEYVTEKYFDGGLANYLGTVAPSLARQGHDVHVVTLSEFDEGEFQHEGVTVHRIKLGEKWQLVNALTRYRLTTTTHWLNLSMQVYRKLKQLNRRQPLRLVQFPNYSYCGLISMILLRAPHVLRASSFEPFFNDSRKERTLDFHLLKLLEKFQLFLSPNIYSPSRRLQQILIRKHRLDRVRVIRKPVFLAIDGWDYSVYDQALKEKNYLLFFGRFEERKGFHILAQALARVLADHADVHAVMIGRDVSTASHSSMADYARSLCGAFGSRLIVMDQLAHRQLYPIITRARLIVLPSLTDNMPNVCLEAMALGKAVVGTWEAGFDEMISDEETGFLVASEDVDALAAKIVYAWSHPKLKEIGDAAQKKTLEFSPEKTTETLLSYYREILQR